MATLKYKDSSGEYIAIPSVQGPAGISISKIEQTVSSSEANGENIWTVTLSNGITSNFTVKNGPIGPVGPTGPAGGILDVAPSATEGYITITNADGTTKEVVVGTAGDFLPLIGGTLTGDLIVDSINTAQFRGVAGGYGFMIRNDGDASYFLLTNQNDAFGTWNDLRPIQISNSTGIVTCGTVLYGAAWNDYAEFRDQNDIIQPGYIAYSDDDGRLKITTERLQKFEGVVSDTFGFAIGETDKCKTPIAVSGRALVYPDPYDHFHSGDCVCAGPGGLAYKMTREEVMMYPDRIVGIVSEIPTYETWGTGNVKVDGRIWIKVR